MGDEDKQFDATPRKLEQARKEGQVVKSKDFSTAVSLLVLFSVIFGLAPFIWNQIVQVFTLLYEQIPNAHVDKIGYMYILLIAVKGAALIIGPILAIAWLVAVLADFIQVGPLVATAPADYGVTKWKFLKDQKMSFKEIKDEYKNSEGDPNVKAQLRQRRMQMLQQGAMDAVPTADFVVTNPTHVACALKYVAEEMDSPMLIAKGTELIAKKIIDIAKENNVPVIENPPVARALFRMVDINHPIPPELYKAVAEILMFVYKMKNHSNKRPRN